MTLALTLNEKGRAALRRKEYGEALLLLLEADKEFRYKQFFSSQCERLCMGLLFGSNCHIRILDLSVDGHPSVYSSNPDHGCLTSVISGIVKLSVGITSGIGVNKLYLMRFGILHVKPFAPINVILSLKYITVFIRIEAPSAKTKF